MDLGCIYHCVRGPQVNLSESTWLDYDAMVFSAGTSSAPGALTRASCPIWNCAIGKDYRSSTG